MTKKGKAKILTKHEFKLVESVAMMGRYGKRNRCILYMSFGIGLKVKEITALRMVDVIQKNFTLRDSIRIGDTITERSRVVYLTNKKLCSVLIDHINDQKLYMENRKIPLNLDRPLFLSQKGSFFNFNQISIIFCKIFKMAGIKNGSLSSGRSTFIKSKIDEGIDINEISKIVGNNRIYRTIEYKKNDTKRLKKISERSILN